MTLITNHTTAGLVLRAPGLAALGDPVDEDRGYKALGDAMAKENGYFSQKSLRALRHHRHDRGLELQRHGRLRLHVRALLRRAQLRDRRLRRPGLPPDLPRRWSRSGTATNPTADHANDPGPNKGYDGKGNREAYYIAAECALNEQRHSVLEGSGAARARRLRLTKDFKTETFPQGPTARADPLDDHLETTYDVGDDGKVRWHVNPSTRPIVAKATGKAERRPAEPARDAATAARPAPPTTRPTTARAPGGDANANNPLNYNDHPITVPAGGDNESMESAASTGRRRRATRT